MCAFVLCSLVGGHVISFHSPLVFIIFYAICCFYPLYIFQWFIVSQSLWVKRRSLPKKLNQKQIHFVGRIKRAEVQCDAHLKPSFVLFRSYVVSFRCFQTKKHQVHVVFLFMSLVASNFSLLFIVFHLDSLFATFRNE